MKQRLSDFLAWLRAIFLKGVASALATGLSTKIIAVLATMGVAWFVTPAEYKPAIGGHDYRMEFQQLNASVARMQAQYSSELKEYRDLVVALQEHDRRRNAEYWKTIDSLEARHARIISIIRGRGQMTVASSGKVLDGWFEDAWLAAQVIPKDDKYDLAYEFKADIEDISTTMVGEDGKQFDVYQVKLRSQKDTNVTMLMPSYRKERLALLRVVADERRWLWDDWALSLDKLFLGESREAALVVTPFSYSTGGAALQNVLVRFPSVGLATDLEHLHVVFGVRGNLAPLVWFIRDAYLSLHYAVGPHSGVRLGIGSTL